MTMYTPMTTASCQFARNGQPDRTGEQHDGHAVRDVDRQNSGRDGPEALGGVSAVGLDVHRVVDEVDARRRHAEHDERERDGQQHVAFGDRPGRERRRQHQDVLDPLAWADRLDDAGGQGLRGSADRTAGSSLISLHISVRLGFFDPASCRRGRGPECRSGEHVGRVVNSQDQAREQHRRDQHRR